MPSYRFLRLRNNDDEKRAYLAHLASASLKHTGFGYGQHACLGRFFSAKELKISSAHLLLKYAWKLSDETSLCRLAWRYCRNPMPNFSSEDASKKSIWSRLGGEEEGLTLGLTCPNNCFEHWRAGHWNGSLLE